MKKITLIALAFLALNLNAQFSEADCGWKFESFQNYSYIGSKLVLQNETKTSFFFNDDCKNNMWITFESGAVDKYYFISLNPIRKGRIDSGENYDIYKMYNYKTDKAVEFQIIYAKRPFVRLIYSNGYTEFQY
jgi:hypothetical protein